jgi:channel protein (hemolysin III family)
MIELLGCADPISSWIHLAGALLALVALRDLTRRGGTRHETIALAVFGVTAVVALTASGVYHLAPPDTAARAILRRIDHAAIWGLIAGTFTPVHIIMFRGVMRWGALAFIWAGALAGIALKTIFFDAVPEGTGMILYVAYGWLGGLSAIALGLRYGRRAVVPLMTGGVAYTLGGVFSMLHTTSPVPGYVGPHEIFHLAVLAALALHWRLLAGLRSVRREDLRLPVRRCELWKPVAVTRVRLSAVARSPRVRPRRIRPFRLVRRDFVADPLSSPG